MPSRQQHYQGPAGPQGRKAIQTAYKGRLFRSRLEARWAVAFDEFRIPWLYEHEGYECGWRLSCGVEREPIHYLPDFELPNHRAIVEVKGEWTASEFDRTMNAWADLGTCRNDPDGEPWRNLLLAGPMQTDPPYGRKWAPWELHFHKGDVIARICPSPNKIGECIMPPCAYIGMDIGPEWWLYGGWTSRSDDYKNLAEVAFVLNGASEISSYYLDGKPLDAPVDWDAWAEFAKAGNSARFEHGESGAMLRVRR